MRTANSDGMRTLSEQLLAAFERSDLTIEQLVERSGLDGMDRSTAQRKLRGVIPMRVSEGEAFALALGGTVRFSRPKAKRAA